MSLLSEWAKSKTGFLTFVQLKEGISLGIEGYEVPQGGLYVPVLTTELANRIQTSPEDEVLTIPSIIRGVLYLLGADEHFIHRKRYEQLLAKLKNETMRFGDILVPVFEAAVDLVSKLADFMGEMSDEQRNLVLVIAGVVFAIAPLLIFFGKLATGVSAIIGLFSGTAATGGLVGAAGVAGGAFTALSLGPLGALILTLGLASAAIMLLIDDFEELKDITNNWSSFGTGGQASSIAADYRNKQNPPRPTDQQLRDADRALMNDLKQLNIETNRLPQTQEISVNGVIRHEGVNDRGELVASTETFMDEFRRELRV